MKDWCCGRSVGFDESGCLDDGPLKGRRGALSLPYLLSLNRDSAKPKPRDA